MKLSLTTTRAGSLWNRLNLWPRLAIAVTLVFAALFALFSALALRAVDDSTDRIRSERLVIARMAARELDRLLQRTERQLTASVQIGAGGALTDEHVLAHVRLALGGAVLGVYSLDGAGNLVRADPPSATPPVGVKRVEFVRRVLATARPAISEPFLHVSGKAAVAIAVPAQPRAPVHSVLVGIIDMNGSDVVGPLEQIGRAHV